MNETLREYCDCSGAAMRVERDAAVIRGVKILGIRSRNGRLYLPEALQRAAALYEGAKVNVNHPKGGPAAPRDYQDRLGVIRHVRFRPDDGLFGDLHYNPKHPIAEQLAWDAEHQAGAVGLSHNVEAITRRQRDQLVVEAINKVTSVDLVADPATTRGLFEQARADRDGRSTVDDDPSDGDASSGAATLESLTLDELAAARPDLIDQLRRQAEGSTGDGDPRRELVALREEVDRLRAESAVIAKRQRIRRMLATHGLPDPETADETQRLLVSDVFLEQLMRTASDADAERLIEERAAAVKAALRPAMAPRCREQLRDHHLPAVADASQFARAIT